MTQPSINYALKENKLKYDTGSATRLKPLGKQASALTGHNASAQADFGALRASSNSKFDSNPMFTQSFIDNEANVPVRRGPTGAKARATTMNSITEPKLDLYELKNRSKMSQYSNQTHQSVSMRSRPKNKIIKGVPSQLTKMGKS